MEKMRTGEVFVLEWCLPENSGVASSISEGDIFIYLCSAQLTPFEIDSISKEINCAEQKYMNMSPSLIELATPLFSGKKCVRKLEKVMYVHTKSYKYDIII